MTDNALLSYISNIDWGAVLQWYLAHLDFGYLIAAWELGIPYDADDWQVIGLLAAHIAALSYFTYLLIRQYREALFRAWIDEKRAGIVFRPPQESRVELEAKAEASESLKQAYNLHRVAMYDNALSKYKVALENSPDDLNTYLVGVKIVSEMDEPHTPFIQLLREGIARLHERHPAIWNELAKYGREKAPNLDQWQSA